MATSRCPLSGFANARRRMPHRLAVKRKATMPKSPLQFTLPHAIPAGTCEARGVLNCLVHLAQMNFDEILTDATGLPGGGLAAVPSKVCGDQPPTRPSGRTGGSVRLATRSGVLSSWSPTGSTTCGRPSSLFPLADECFTAKRTRPHSRTTSNRTGLMHVGRVCARCFAAGFPPTELGGLERSDET